MRSRSSGVLRTCAATDVAWPGRMGTAKLVALGEVVALEVAMLVLGVLLGADVTVCDCPCKVIRSWIRSLSWWWVFGWRLDEGAEETC